ncbi:MAG: hypothetical protein PVG98_01465 [Chromatiales bacterium]
MADDPMMGVNRYEAEAYAAWVAAQAGALAGAALRDELQWEAATRTRAVRELGRVYEWCSNLFEPYDDYRPPAHAARATREFDGRHVSLRGASLHAQPTLRRARFRNRALPHQALLFAGLRLIFPPD